MSSHAPIRLAETPEQLDWVRTLFKEYGDFLRVIHAEVCFGDFEREMAELPGRYSSPTGCLLLASDGEIAAGCVALRPWAEGICEMKRLYVRPQFRGQNLGKRLAWAVIEEARKRQYGRIRLDTLPEMRAAQALYRSLGFLPVDSRWGCPLPGALYLEMSLNETALPPGHSAV